MSFEEWQAQNNQVGAGGFDAWQAENEMVGIDLPTGGGLQEFGKGVVDSFLVGAKGAVGTLGMVLGAPKENVLKVGTPWGPLPSKEQQQETMQTLAGATQKIEAAREPFEMTHQGTAAKAGRILGNAVGYMGQALAGGYVAGPVGAAMVGFNIEGQNAYDEAIASGATEIQAEAERLIVGSINATIEALQIGKVMKFTKTGKHSVKAFVNAVRTKSYKKMGQLGKEFGADILRHSIEEGLEEFAQEGVSMAVPAALRGEYPMKEDGSPDMWAIGERLGTAAVGGAFAGSVLGTGASVIQADVMAPSRKKIEKVTQKIKESDISDRAKARMIKDLEKLLPDEGQLEIPESTRKVLNIADNVATTLKDMQSKRQEFEEHVKEGRAKTFGKQAKILEEMQADDPLIAKKAAQGVAKGELRKDFPDVAEKFSQEDWKTLVQSINEATDINEGERRALWETLDDLFIKQKPPGEARLKMFDKFFGTDIYQSTKNIPQTKWGKILNKTADILNIRKAVLASFDASIPLRQAWEFTLAHPIKSIPIWGKMLKAIASPTYTKFIELEMQTHPRFQMYKKGGLTITKMGHRTEGQEYFQSEMAHKIPIIGAGVRAAERGGVTYLNLIRFQSADYFYELKGSPKTNTKLFQDIIDHVNHASSQGGFKGRAGKWFKKWSPELGAVLWTPKMLIGKTQSILDLRKPTIRKMVACELLRAFGGASLLAMLMALGFGGKIGKDPRSSDFGKVVIGKTRLDMFGTYLPIFRVIAQSATGERKAATTGRLSDVERNEIVTRFLRSKLNPMAGTVWDIISKETFLGKKMKFEGDFLSEYIYEAITPLFIQDLHDAIKYQGWDILTLVAPLAGHGAGAATHEPTPRGDEVELKNHYAHQAYGSSWDELGPAAQKILRAYRPEIIKAEEATKRAREDYTFIGKLAQEEQDVGKRVGKKLKNSVQKEMNRLGVSIGGLRRQLKGNWYLNKKRYNQYQQELKTTLNKAISNLISNPSWYRLNDDVQEVMLQTTIDQCKKLIRARIVNQANLKDLEQMRR